MAVLTARLNPGLCEAQTFVAYMILDFHLSDCRSVSNSLSSCNLIKTIFEKTALETYQEINAKNNEALNSI